MTTYYVRTTGNNANAGTSAGAAWLTITYAVAHVASGDTIYVGAGTYREAVSGFIDAAATTSMIGDVQGINTGDAGEIVVTARLTNDTTLPTASTTINLGAARNWLLQYLTVIGGKSNTSCLIITTTASQGASLTLRDCNFWAMASLVDGSGTYGISFVHTGAMVAQHILMERCRVFAHAVAGATVRVAGSNTLGTTDVDRDVTLRNCIIWNTAGNGAVDIQGGNTTHPGGTRIYNCLLTNNNGGYAVINTNGNLSTSVPNVVYNSLLLGSGFSALVAGSIVEDYNIIDGDYGQQYNNVTQGTHTIVDGSYDVHLMWGQEWMYGAAPRPFGMPPAGSPLLAFGSFDTSVTDDILQGIRPGSGNGSVVRALGPFERGNSATKNTSTLYSTIPQSVQFSGPGYQDFQLPVPHGNVNVAIQARFDGTYTGTLPQMFVRNGGECGVSDANVTTTGSANTWTQISLSFNTTAVGIVTIRLQSNDTAGTGKAFFAYAVVT